ncbi:MAG: hypothetical protein IPL65_12415 [Lewinellaceae bacterium]|nr:hypothetical protein [Lewinellaceae bacterium]
MAFETATFRIGINASGQLIQLQDKASGINYCPKDTLAAFFSIRCGGVMQYPSSVKKDASGNLVFRFDNGASATVLVQQKTTHLTFELTRISGPATIELIVWGPFRTSISETIGETVGVVRNQDFAIGLQAVNPKTLGGYPWTDNDCMPQLDIFDQNDPSDLSEAGKRYVLYRVEAAKPEMFGSTLQAYCRNRDAARVIENWDHPLFTAAAFEDGGVVGSKIALFGCPASAALATIGAIELAENLPHPMIDGQWGKTAPTASAAYLIMGFDEARFEEALDVAQKASLRYLYHDGPFETWGHFILNPSQFPDGPESMRRCVEKAAGRGIMLGVHTLSNFISTNDPYVTPVPDPRLAKVGSSVIGTGIDARQTEIPIASPDFFRQYQNNNLKTVVLDQELIRYGSVSETAPWTLLDCQRGAYGTSADRHDKGAPIAVLADHGYKVFLSNSELGIEMAQNIADLFNQTGLRQISFDGLEGNRSTGMGNYGEILFTNAWYQRLSDETRSHYIADASRTSHYFWHIYTRMNWGEPWYAGFRESQTEYRLKNQQYFKRNLMPGMLGWFSMQACTSVEDIEWMLARSAAFDAGYGFVTNFDVLQKNGSADEILRLIGEWEKARMTGAFSVSQKQRMEDLKNEFQLETTSEDHWNLYQVYSFKFRHTAKVRQPGEPLYSNFDFSNPVASQPMQFILTVVDADISAIRMELDNYKVLHLATDLKAGETCQYKGGKLAIVYDANWQKIRETPMDPSDWAIAPGPHQLNYECLFTQGKLPEAKLEIRLMGEAELVEGQ